MGTEIWTCRQHEVRTMKSYLMAIFFFFFGHPGILQTLDLLSSNKGSQWWTSVRYKAAWLLLAQPCSHRALPLSIAITFHHSWRSPSPTGRGFTLAINQGDLAGAETVIHMSASSVILEGRAAALPPLPAQPPTLHTHTC